MFLEINYIGEHLLPGQIGQIAIIASFVASLLAAASFFIAMRRSEEVDFKSWRYLGRTAFTVHGIGVFTIIGLIFYIMVNQYYEYYYVFNHVNEDLPFQYIFSAFWEGQEGSFLLWMFWHVVLGFVLIFTARQWESPVLGVISLVQVFTGSMLLGLYFGFGDDPIKIGSNPLILLRDAVEAPIFSDINYLEKIKGTGLNPLLQNYWMTIHPPTLFLGFASTVVPFAFAMAGLLTNQHKAWLKPALPWSLFSAAILGIGILMGGAWAYEALSFGGYWAWDPVENMSLVPWLVLLAGVHTHLIAKSTGYSIRSTYVFYLLTFVLILYSTFLTRSGVLGDTSVHAFTEMGLEWQLVIFISTFVLLGFIPYFVKYQQVPAPKKEEALASKEFWMFIGSLVLLFSAIMITASTSLPVYNKIRQFFDPAFVGQVISDPVEHYNKYQLWIAVFMALLSGGVQFLRWREPNWSKNASKFFIHTAIALGGAAILTWLTSLWIETFAWQYSVLLYTGYFTVISNVDYAISVMRGNLKGAGSALSHVGFGLMLVGVIASGLNQFHISTNPFAQRGLISEERLGKNIMLFKGIPMFMSGYKVTYVDDQFEGNNRRYQVNFQKMEEDGRITEEFNLYPTALYDNKLTKVAAYNPDTKHYLSKDIFTHIASIAQSEADVEFARQQEDSLNYKPYLVNNSSETILLDTVPIRDTQIVRRHYVQLQEVVTKVEDHPDYVPQEGDIAVGLRLQLQDDERDSVFTATPISVLRGPYMYTYPVHVQELALKVRVNEDLFRSLFPAEEELDYQIYALKRQEQFELGEFVVEFSGFNREVSHPMYQAQEGDIAVGAFLRVYKKDQPEEVATAQPVFFIRGNQPNNLKDQISKWGLHFRFNGLDPRTEAIELLAARTEPIESAVPVDIAYAPRTDFLVLESIVFPGINFFWLGSILMMLGLLTAMFYRLKR